MKTNIILLLLILFSYSRMAAQDKPIKNPYTFGVKINPISILALATSLSAEVFVSDKNSIQIGFQYWGGFIPVFSGNSFARINGASIAYRHYIGNNACRSAFVEPFTRYNNLWEINEIGTVKIYTCGIVFGKQWISKNVSQNNYSFEIFAGPYYSNPIAEGFDPKHDPRPVISQTMNEKNQYNGLWIRAGVTVGVFF
ncbi:MAG: hypothetical protein NTU43_11780 [Bacteroidetes bacterium]|nr:hypothetical protein [Bacteroidota bacterium]